MMSNVINFNNDSFYCEKQKYQPIMMFRLRIGKIANYIFRNNEPN